MSSNISTALFQDISQLIEGAKTAISQYANSSLILLYWQIGQKIHKEILKEKRAEYGNEIVNQLSRQLGLHYGRGFDARSLFRMIRFAKHFPKKQIVMRCRYPI